MLDIMPIIGIAGVGVIEPSGIIDPSDPVTAFEFCACSLIEPPSPHAATTAAVTNKRKARRFIRVLLGRREAPEKTEHVACLGADLQVSTKEAAFRVISCEWRFVTREILYGEFPRAHDIRSPRWRASISFNPLKEPAKAVALLSERPREIATDRGNDS
jgi:hypothetical protein